MSDSSMSNLQDEQFIYAWIDPEQHNIERRDSAGNKLWIPADPANTDYALILESGAEILPFGS